MSGRTTGLCLNCNEVFDKSELHKQVDRLGFLCTCCIDKMRERFGLSPEDDAHERGLGEKQRIRSKPVVPYDAEGAAQVLKEVEAMDGKILDSPEVKFKCLESIGPGFMSGSAAEKIGGLKAPQTCVDFRTKPVDIQAVQLDMMRKNSRPPVVVRVEDVDKLPRTCMTCGLTLACPYRFRDDSCWRDGEYQAWKPVSEDKKGVPPEGRITFVSPEDTGELFDFTQEIIRQVAMLTHIPNQKEASDAR